MRVRVDYDFASTLCYVAQRALQRIAAEIEGLGVELWWSPLDLSRLLGWPRHVPVEAARRANVARVAQELEVPVRIPGLWYDSRAAHAIALAIAPAREPTWRERVFTATFEEGRPLDEATVEALADELGLSCELSAREDALAELERRTLDARAQEVTGVPNFMLGRWPFGGIQTDETMLHVLGRFAARQRASRAS